jgi:hypothetical protein
MRTNHITNPNASKFFFDASENELTLSKQCEQDFIKMAIIPNSGQSRNMRELQVREIIGRTRTPRLPEVGLGA